MARYKPQKGERIKLKDTGNLAIIAYINNGWINKEYSVWEHQIATTINGFPEYNSIGVRKVSKKNIEKIAKVA